MKRKTQLIIIILSIHIVDSVSAQVPNIYINEILTSNSHINYDPDFTNYVDWIEIFNDESRAVDLGGYYLSDNLNDSFEWMFPINTIILPKNFLVIYADGKTTGLHSNFKLNREKDDIGLFTPNGNIIDTLSYKSQVTNVSFGRNHLNKDEWLYYSTPTPNAENNTKGLKSNNICDSPIFSLASGFYSNNNTLELYANDSVEIHYTLDGSEPTEDSELYVEPLDITDRTTETNYFSNIPTNNNPYSWFPDWKPPIQNIFKATVVRAKSYTSNKLPSKIITKTYFVNPDIFNKYQSVPIISLVSDEKHLFSDSAGIYVPGDNFTGISHSGNYMKRWWRPAHIEYFDDSHNIRMAQDVTIKTQGSSSKTSPQKSLHIISGRKDNKDFFDHPIFQSRLVNPQKIKRFIARTWGSNWNQGMVNDALAQTYFINSSLAIQDYRLAIMFINGEYWGLHELREANKYPSYFNEHYKIDIENVGIDMMIGANNNYVVAEGDDVAWLALNNFLESNSLANIQNYKYVESLVDINSYIDYIGHCVFFAKTDWPIGNEAFWRTKTPDGKWRWIQYDMDICFGQPEYNSINHVFNGTTSRQPHFLLNHLIINKIFRARFINWFMDRINGDYQNDFLNLKYDNILNEIYPHIEEHRNRWSIKVENFGIFTTFTRNFINVRHDIIVDHIRSYFNLGELVNVTVNRNNKNGTIKINSLLLKEDSNLNETSIFPWNGEYFKNVPINLLAIPNEGYEFDRWEGNSSSSADSISHTPVSESVFTAFFTVVDKIQNLVINEILVDNYSINNDSMGDYDGWIELFNSGNDTIDLTNLYFSDDPNFPKKWRIIPNDSTVCRLFPNEYKIFWCDKEPFEGLDHIDIILENDGGYISIVQVVGDDAVVIDSVTYPFLSSNISFGRLPEDQNKWSMLLTPSPGKENSGLASSVINKNKSVLFQNYPNPFNNFTLIPVYLSDLKVYRVSIFDIKGNLIKEYNIDNPISGLRSIIWNGLDSQDKIVPSGIFFYSLFSDNKLMQTKKMLFIK